MTPESRFRTLVRKIDSLYKLLGLTVNGCRGFKTKTKPKGKQPIFAQGKTDKLRLFSV